MKSVMEKCVDVDRSRWIPAASSRILAKRGCCVSHQHRLEVALEVQVVSEGAVRGGSWW